MLIQVIFFTVSLLLTFLFFVYGFNLYYLLSASRKYNVPPLPPDLLENRPQVAIHLPIYNEKYVIGRLVDACIRMAETDVHFLIEQTGRYATGSFQNFNGSGGVLRRKAMLEAGGWQADTLAEDLDISYRIQLRGYRILFLSNVESPGEIPLTVPSFKKQQGRWANGSLRTARKILPSLLVNRDLSINQRLEAFIHLTGYLIHPLMFFSFLLACLSTIFHVDSFRILRVDIQTIISGNPEALKAGFGYALHNLTWILLTLMILLCTVAAWFSPMIVLRTQKLSIGRNIGNLVILFLLGCGVSLSNTIEAGKALLTNQSWAFRRTPKYALQHEKERWQTKKYQVPLDYVWVLELILASLGIFSIVDAIWRTNYDMLVILVPYTIAYAFVVTLTAWQSQSGARV